MYAFLSALRAASQATVFDRWYWLQRVAIALGVSAAGIAQAQGRIDPKADIVAMV